jgi:hypothetical protein
MRNRNAWKHAGRSAETMAAMGFVKAIAALPRDDE